MASFSFEAIGTHWVIDAKIASDKEVALLSKIKARIKEFENNYSRFLPDSIVGKISRAPGDYEMPADFLPMISLYKDLYDLTGGYFTPLIGNALADAGYDEKYSLKQRGQLIAPPQWDDVLAFKHPVLTVKYPVLLDFGAAGKGYIVDIVSKILADEGVTDFCVDAGGDMLQRSATGQTLRVGLENPTDTLQVIGVANIRNKSIAGSAGSRRKWADFTHILNPQTLKSPKNILAVWAVADSTFLADAMTTCLFFVAPEILLAKYDFEYFILNSDFSIDKSENFPAEIFSA